MPPVVVHELFADHEDTVCDFRHRHGVTTVEARHTHCAAFTSHAPVYDAPRLIVVVKPFAHLIAEIKALPLSFHIQTQTGGLPSRAPPIA